MNLNGMGLYVPGLGQHGLQQLPSQKQHQLLLQQHYLLTQEIALKKAQLLQQQHQHQLAVLQQQALQQQQQKQLEQQQQQQQHQAQQQVFSANQAAFCFQPIKNLSPSPDCPSSGTSSPISHFSSRTFDQIEDWEVPSHDLMQKIIQQVEYYFSNEYLTRDAYFLRQIRRKREGYLSMKLITNFKKVRKLVKDPRITSYCLRQSQTLQVNEDGTKVRRIAAIPEDLRRFAV
jgi:multidrug efflux pump subunit AcrA (membrane-fusion protein)